MAYICFQFTHVVDNSAEREEFSRYTVCNILVYKQASVGGREMKNQGVGVGVEKGKEKLQGKAWKVGR